MLTHIVSASLYPNETNHVHSNQPYVSNSVASESLSLDHFFIQDEIANDARVHAVTDNDPGSDLTNHSSQYFASIQRRLTSTDRSATLGIEPTYHLLVAFNPPPLLQLAMEPRRPFAQHLHWTNQITTHASRLSGWKDSNLLYSHMHGKPLSLS